MSNPRTNVVPETTDAQRDAERVYRLVLDLKRAKQEKKVATRMLGEEVKRIQAEIDEIINREPVVEDGDPAAEE